VALAIPSQAVEGATVLEPPVSDQKGCVARTDVAGAKVVEAAIISCPTSKPKPFKWRYYEANIIRPGALVLHFTHWAIGK